MNLLFAKIGLAAAILIGACVATWFAADAHYGRALSSLRGQLEGTAKAQETAVEAQIQKDREITQGVQNDAQEALSGRDGVIADLRLRLNTRRSPVEVRPAATSTGCTDAGPVGPAAPASPGQSADAAGSARQGVCLDPITLRDALDTGTDALKAEQFWRRYARGTGQAP